LETATTIYGDSENEILGFYCASGACIVCAAVLALQYSLFERGE
jgi:hypothetical protein